MRTSFWFVGILLAFLLSLAPSAPRLEAASPKVAQQSGGGQRFVTIDFNDVDINVFIKYISELTQKNFVVDRDVKGKVTVISPTRISEEDAWRVFESVLEVHGYAAVPSGSVTKIVPSVTARTKNILTLHDGDPLSQDDRIVTQIVSLKYASADEVRNLLAPLVSKNSVLISHASSSMLIMTDYQTNIARLLEIVRAVDVPSDADEMVVIPLHRTSADSVSKAVGQLFAAGPAQKGMRAETVKVIPFDRTNALIVMASKASMQRIRALIAKLDEDTPRKGNLRLIYLQHAKAEELVKVLMNLPGDLSGAKGGGMGGSAPGGSAVSKEVKLVADTSTNALIVTGPQEEYEALEEIVKKLDIPRRMVYLEALIMEVKVTKDFQIGVEWAGGDGSVIGGFSGGAGANSYSNLRTLGTGRLPAGVTLGVLDKGINIGGVTFENLGAVVNAYKSDDDVNVIATPQILTTDNKKATIKVGENVPYITSKNTTSGTQQDYTNYDYKDVATSLTITPQVNQAEVMRLEIGVEVIKLKDANNDAPTTFKRTAETTVVVHNEQTVVIGGMIGQDSTTGEYKVPLLGDIPLFGWLFKSHGNKQEKTNLYIFITPHIVENPAELAALYQKKRDTMESVHRIPGDAADQFFHPKEDPAHSVALTDIGFAKLQQNDLLRAREYFTQALKIDPDNAAALLNLAQVCEREGKWREAENLYRRILALPVPKQEGGSGLAANDPLRGAAQAGLQRVQYRK
ncbi:MAG: type II secretion system secretin GspD [Desulfobulbus sp.]|jgi:general secretion pathway protein D|uniref:type II secretion system secretin GspD n=1 Tax=Desulfobulbus sp. TaxID=895 RepID=UPI002841B188|nr:type II secretion system secretin GspD [Desulfobulbus sp.]MDR2548852.1 type II secretion system secretin GspD [Desulfobulbus sp.]